MKDHQKTKAQLIKELGALRQSEERYRQLFESANDAIISLTLDGIITAVNRGAEVLLGWSREEQLGRHYREFLTPSSFAFTEERARRIQAGEKVSSIYEVEVVRKDGSVVPVDGRSRFIRDREGKPIGILVINRDLTARKRAEEALRQAERKYHTLVDHIHDGVFIIQDGKMQFANDAFASMVGYTVDEVTGIDFRELVAPEDVEMVADRYHRRQAGEEVPWAYEFRMLHRDKRTRVIVDMNTTLITYQGKVASMGTVRDITERKRAEEALRESEKRYRNLFENAGDAIISASQDGMITTVNRGFEVMTGWSREELIGQHYHKITTPTAVALEQERTRRALAGEKLPSVYEVEVIRKDGSVVPVEGRARSIRDREGKPAGFQAILRDITERKQVEKEKQKLQEQLPQVQKLETVGTLAGGIAHDFNNILSAILGFTQLVTDEVPEGTVARRNLEEVLKASRRAKGLVQQLLTFSRPNNQGYRPIQLHPIVEEIVAFLRALPTKTIAIQHSIDAPLAPVLADPTQIQQVLMNLCLNAVQAMEKRGGVLEVSLARAEVDGASAQIPPNLKPGPHVRLTVRDTGCGMTPRVMQRIFDPFFTTKPVGQGSGLGLSTVHRIVANHGGAITVESQPGEGTTFHVYLPLSEDIARSENALYQSSSLTGASPENEKGEFSHATHSGD